MGLTPLASATLVTGPTRRAYIGAYGSEGRTLGWLNLQSGQGAVLSDAVLFRYRHTKGNRNRIGEVKSALARVGVTAPREVTYDAWAPVTVEASAVRSFGDVLADLDEVVLDISAMTKLLVLVSLCQLRGFPGTVRIVYAEAEDYVPSREEYEGSKADMGTLARFPSRGVQLVVRARCLSSIRMQGQPVALVAFTSFNEQLVRHMLGTMSPHRLLFINGRPPRSDYAWRERATQEIHGKLIEQYPFDNQLDERGWLKRVASTLDYRETASRLDSIYRDFGTHERIICAATGSKMQTVGLFFSKVAHPDIHIEYPTPDSYFVKGASQGVRAVHEIVVPEFSRAIAALALHGHCGG